MSEAVQSPAGARRSGGEPLTLGQLGLIIWRNWIIILVLSLLGVAGGYAAAQVLPAVYTATAIQLVKGVPGTGAAADYEAAQYAVSRAKSYPSFIYSLPVMEGVHSDLDGDIPIVELREQLTATNPVDTPLIQITAEGSTAAEAQAKANSAARHLARFITQVETISGKTPIAVETAVQAGLPTEPTSPRTLLLVGLGGIAGLCLAMLVALIRAYRPRKGRRVRLATEQDSDLDEDGVDMSDQSMPREPDPTNGSKTTRRPDSAAAKASM